MFNIYRQIFRITRMKLAQALKYTLHAGKAGSAERGDRPREIGHTCVAAARSDRRCCDRWPASWHAQNQASSEGSCGWHGRDKRTSASGVQCSTHSVQDRIVHSSPKRKHVSRPLHSASILRKSNANGLIRCKGFCVGNTGSASVRASTVQSPVVRSIALLFL